MEDESILRSKFSTAKNYLKPQIGTSSLNPNLESLIYEIRGQQVMLDSDLARLYGCANGTKRYK